MIELMLLLTGGHYLADFALQNDYMAKMKSRVGFESMGFHALTAHAMIHGLVAAAAVGVLGYDWVGPYLVVAGSHWLIDLGKAWDGWTKAEQDKGTPGGGLYGINIDQALHIWVLTAVAVALVI